MLAKHAFCLHRQPNGSHKKTTLAACEVVCCRNIGREARGISCGNCGLASKSKLRGEAEMSGVETNKRWDGRRWNAEAMGQGKGRLTLVTVAIS